MPVAGCELRHAVGDGVGFDIGGGGDILGCEEAVELVDDSGLLCGCE